RRVVERRSRGGVSRRRRGDGVAQIGELRRPEAAAQSRRAAGRRDDRQARRGAPRPGGGGRRADTTGNGERGYALGRQLIGEARALGYRPLLAELLERLWAHSDHGA